MDDKTFMRMKVTHIILSLSTNFANILLSILNRIGYKFVKVEPLEILVNN